MNKRKHLLDITEVLKKQALGWLEAARGQEISIPPRPDVRRRADGTLELHFLSEPMPST